MTVLAKSVSGAAISRDGILQCAEEFTDPQYGAKYYSPPKNQLTPSMKSDIRKRIAVGAGWTISLRWVDRIIALVSITILARLILPAEFGIVAYAMVFLHILQEFSMFSFRTVLLRDQDAPKERYDTAWTLEALKGLVLATIIAGSAGAVAKFFNEPKLQQVLYFIALVPILRGFENIGTIDFQKKLEMHKEFRLNTIVQLFGTLTTVAFAFWLRSYWALVIGILARSGSRLVLSYLLVEYRPRLCLSETSRVMGFSSWLLAQNIYSSIYNRLPALTIGRFFDSQSLAFFNMARELTNMATDQFAAPVRQALLPGITILQDDPEQMETTTIAAVGIIALIGLPVAVGIGATAPLLIPTLLGSNWVEVTPIIEVLSILAAAWMLYSNSNVIYLAMNKPQIMAHISLLRVLVTVPLTLAVVPDHGPIGAAWTLVAVQGVFSVAEYVVLFRLTSITFTHVVAAVWRSVLAVSVMAVCVRYLLVSPPTTAIGEFALLHLAICVASGAVVYLGMVGVLWWSCGKPDGAEAHVAKTLSGLYARRAKSGHEVQVSPEQPNQQARPSDDS